MNILKILYGTNQAIQRSEAQVNSAEPAKIIYSQKDTDHVKSLNWFTSLRKNLLLTDKSILLGKNSFDLDSILKVKCYHFKSILFIKYIILKVALQNGSYIYIGMNKNDEILKSLQVDHENEYPKINFANYFLFVILILFLIYTYFR
jgi:hypothetical protein